MAKAAAPVAAPGEDVAAGLAGAFQSAQSTRLLRRGRRDDLIAAALVAHAPGAAASTDEDLDKTLETLATKFPSDPLAAYVAALLCNTRKAPCRHPEYRQRLLEIDPANAIHWLIVPGEVGLSSEDLQRASRSTAADTHFSALLGIVRRSLEGRDAGDATPVAWRGNRELALMLRRAAIARVPWPNYAQTMRACNAQAAMPGADPATKGACARLGGLLFRDRGSNIASMMVGSTLLRRFSKNTPEAEAATRLRRQYVWMSEQIPEDRASSEQERLNEEEVSLGEWEAYQRSAGRAGITRQPPADWTPKRPEMLLLQEERTAADKP